MAVTTSITVRFGPGSGDGDGKQGHLSAEIDDRDTGLNNGKTSFAPGDTVYFLVYKSNNVLYDTPVATAGAIRFQSSETVTKTQQVSFTGEHSASLSVPAIQIKNVQWIGRALGAVTLDPAGQIVKIAPNDNPSQLVGMCNITYTARADAWALASPSIAAVSGLEAGAEEYEISIVIFGQVT